jgi:hypothetical protein
MLRRASRVAYTILLVCAVTTLELRAQQSTDGAKPPDNILDGTKAALTREWRDPEGVKHVLKAFGLLTSGPQDPDVVGKVLKELGEGATDSEKVFYQAAMGDPDHGHPRTQGLPNFLDILAKANTRNAKSPKDLSALFSETEKGLEQLFNSECTKDECGKLALLRANDAFSRKDNYVALFQLLNAYQCDKQKSDDDKNGCAADLDILRAAFEMNVDLLAKQVAAKITASKN